MRNLDSLKIFSKIYLVLVFISSLPAISQDAGNDLYERNLEASKYIKSLQMDCSGATSVCSARNTALRSESIFNDLIEEVIEREVFNWPNGEFKIIEEAFFIRQGADYSFGDRFFGPADEQYLEAAEMIEKVLDSADQRVAELLSEGELYLYEDKKPEWAESYYRDALPYDPDNRDILKGIAEIEFLLNFDDKKAALDALIQSNQFDIALEELEILLDIRPNNEELRDYKYKIQLKTDEKRVLDDLNEIVDEINELIPNYEQSCEEDVNCNMQVRRISFNLKRALGEIENTYLALYEITGDDFYQDEDFYTYYLNAMTELDNVVEIRSARLAAEEMSEIETMLAMSLSERRQAYKEEVESNNISSSSNTELIEGSDLNFLQANLKEVESLYVPEGNVEAAEKKSSFLNSINNEIKTLLNDSLQSAEEKENWQDALNVLEDINELIPTTGSREKVISYSLILDGISKIEKYQDAPSLLYNKKELDIAKNLLKSFDSLDSVVQNTTKLNADLASFKETIQDAELFIAEAEKEKAEQERLAAAQREERRRAAEELRKKEEAAKLQAAASKKKTNETNLPPTPTISSTTPKQSNSVSVSQKPKLDYASFGQSVYCQRSYRNREFIATFKILVSSDGQAKSVETLYIRKSDGSDMEMNGNDNKILEVVNEALLRSKFRPGRMDDIAVDTTFNLPLKVPARFCG